MTLEEYEKVLKWIKIFCIVVGICAFITSNIIQAIIYVIALYLFYTLTKKRNVIGPIIGIVLGVLYIGNLKLISIIIGVLLILACGAMYKFILDVRKK